MAALHVVGVDLELGPRVDLGAGAEQQVAVRLPCLRALGVHVDYGLAVEHTPPAARGDAAVVDEALRVRREMVDADVRIEVTRAVGQEEARERGTGARRREPRVQVETREGGLELGIVDLERRPGAERGFDPLDQESARPRGLQPIQVQARAGIGLDFDVRVHEMLHIGAAHVLQDDASGGPGTGADDQARVRHVRLRARRRDHDVQGLGRRGALLDVDEDGLVAQGGVQGGEPFRTAAGRNAEYAALRFAALERLGEGPHTDSRRQARAFDELAVQERDPVRCEGRCRRQCGRGRRATCRLEAARLEPAQARVLPCVVARGRETEFGEAGERLPACGGRLAGRGADGLEGGPVGLEHVMGDGCVHATAASCRTQS